MLASFLRHQLDIPPETIERVLTFYNEEQIAKDDNLLKQGQYSQKLYFINEGYVRFYSYSKSKPITHWIFGKGQLVTDIASFYLNEPAKWNIQALSETSALAITLTDYRQLRETIPEWDMYENRLLAKLMSALENRVYTFLSMSADERFQYLFEDDAEMFNKLPLHYISSMLGMTPETLSRIRSKRVS